MEEQGGGKSHFLSPHGDQVDIILLKQRAIDGTLPETGELPARARAVDSTRWLNNEDMLTAIKQDQAMQAVNKGLSQLGYVSLTKSGQPITAYPKLPELGTK